MLYDGFNFKFMYKIEFEHPKHGQQINDKEKLSDLLQWTSYMIAFHKISQMKFYEGNKEIYPDIPKW
jgi:hypothetical protein